MNVIPEVHVMNVIPEVHVMNLIPEVHVMNVIPEVHILGIWNCVNTFGHCLVHGNNLMNQPTCLILQCLCHYKFKISRVRLVWYTIDLKERKH
jgi:hypothetical protein